MPYRSDAQRRWAHTPTGIKALGGRGKVAEWDRASKGMNLPERRAEGGDVPTSHAVGYEYLPSPRGNPIGPWNPYGGSQGQVGGMSFEELARQSANRGPGGIDITRSGDSARPMRGDQLDFRHWVPAFWPPNVQAPEEDIPEAPPVDDIPRQEFTYPTETLPQAEPPPIPDFLNRPGTQALPSGQFMPRWIPPIEPMEDREGYDAGGMIAGMPIGGSGGTGGQPPITPDQLGQQYPMAQSMWGNPELMLPFAQMMENIMIPGEAQRMVSDGNEGMTVAGGSPGTMPFQNFGRTLGLPQMTREEFAQRVREQWGPNLPPHAQREMQSVIDNFNPNDSNTIWGAIDPNWPIDYGPMPEAPAPEQPAPEPAPTPAPTPRREYTYPTETLPVAEPPPVPSFLSGQRQSGPPRWIPPIQPLRPMENDRNRRAYGGRTHGPGQASGPEQARPNAFLQDFIARTRAHFGYPAAYAEGGGTRGSDPLSIRSQQGPIPPGTTMSAADVGIPSWWGGEDRPFNPRPGQRVVGDPRSPQGSPGAIWNDYALPEGWDFVSPDNVDQYDPAQLQWRPINPKKWGLTAGPAPQPEPEAPPPPPPVEPEPEAPRQEYTYPTETLPVAEPPPTPSFQQPGQRSRPRWLPSIEPISGETFIPMHRRGGKVSSKDINRARLRATVSAKRGDFHG
jgi:hypothetical protein